MKCARFSRAPVSEGGRCNDIIWLQPSTVCTSQLFYLFFLLNFFAILMDSLAHSNNVDGLSNKSPGTSWYFLTFTLPVFFVYQKHSVPISIYLSLVLSSTTKNREFPIIIANWTELHDIPCPPKNFPDEIAFVGSNNSRTYSMYSFVLPVIFFSILNETSNAELT